MIDQLLKFYKKKATSYSLVFRYVRTNYFFANIMLFIFVISILALAFISLIAFEAMGNFLPYIITPVILFIIFIFSVVSLNNKSKKVLLTKYKIKVNAGSWKSSQFQEFQNSIIKDYLKQYGIYNETKIKLLIEMINKEIERKKVPSLIAPGIALTLIIPVWIQVLRIVYSNITTIDEAIIMATSITSAVILSIIFFNFIKWLLPELFDMFVLSKVSLSKALVEKLENILITVPVKENKEKKFDIN